jgi:nucleoside-diphosphate-sugar epimerase
LTAQRVSTINGRGEQTRDYTYVGDVARANVLALEGDPPSGAYNVGTAVETTVNELYELLQDLSGEDLPARHGPAKSSEPLAVPSTRHARVVSLAGTRRCNWPPASKRPYGSSKRAEGRWHHVPQPDAGTSMG